MQILNFLSFRIFQTFKQKIYRMYGGSEVEYFLKCLMKRIFIYAPNSSITLAEI